MRQLKREKLQAQYAAIDALYEREPEAWSSVPIEEMKDTSEAQVLGVTEPLIRLKNFLNDDYVWRIDEKTKGSLRAEILQDLSPILDPASDTGVGPALQNLVDKINRMQLYSPWQVSERSDPSFELSPEIARLFAGDLFVVDGPKLEALGPVLRLGSRKFVVHNHYDFDLDAPATNRLDFYTIIIRALTDGTFHKLKKCRECPSFFIADRLSDRFCRPKCSETFFGRDAANRVRQSRAKQLRPTKKTRPTKRKANPSRSGKGNRPRQSH